MSRLTWEARDYQNGLDRGVFYPIDGFGEAWSGLIAVEESLVEISDRVVYRDGLKTVNYSSAGIFAASISAYMFPPSFLLAPKKPFGFSYRIQTAKSYKIHLVYNALVNVADIKYAQQDQTPFTFNISTSPILVPEAKPSSHLIIDANVVWPEAMSAFETILYGDDASYAYLPTPTEVYDLFDLHAIYNVIDNGDGTATFDAPDETFTWLDPTEVNVDWPKVITVDENSYQLRSW